MFYEVCNWERDEKGLENFEVWINLLSSYQV